MKRLPYVLTAIATVLLLLRDHTGVGAAADVPLRWCVLGLGLTTLALVMNLGWGDSAFRVRAPTDRVKWRRILWRHRHGDTEAPPGTPEQGLRDRTLHRVRAVLGASDGRGEPTPPAPRPMPTPGILRDLLSRPLVAWSVMAASAIAITVGIAALPATRVLPDLRSGDVAGWCGRGLAVVACSYLITQPAWTAVKLALQPDFEIGVVGTRSSLGSAVPWWCSGFGATTVLTVDRVAPRPDVLRGGGLQAGLAWSVGTAATPWPEAIADLAATSDLLVIVDGKDDVTPPRIDWRDAATPWLPPSRIIAVRDATQLTATKLHRLLTERERPPGAPDLAAQFAYGRFSNGVLIGLALLALAVGMVAVGGASLRVPTTFVFVGSLLALFPYLLGAARRQCVDPHVLRAPRAPRMSWILSHHGAHSFWLDGLWAGLCMVWGPGARAALYWFRASTAPLFVATALAVVSTSRFVYARGTVRLAKWILDSHFRIVVFRRNHEATAATNRRVVMPVCGAYGQIVSIADPALVNAPAGTMWETEEALSEVDALLSCDTVSSRERRDPRGWCRLVVDQLAVADFAVFHWHQVPTANMKWELYQALRRLSADRVLFVCSVDSVGGVISFLEATLARIRVPGDAATTVRVLVLAPLATDTAKTRFMRAQLHEMMARLRRCPRAVSTRPRAASVEVEVRVQASG